MTAYIPVFSVLNSILCVSEPPVTPFRVPRDTCHSLHALAHPARRASGFLTHVLSSAFSRLSLKAIPLNTAYVTHTPPTSRIEHRGRHASPRVRDR